jgi:peroxiredoxin
MNPLLIAFAVALVTALALVWACYRLLVDRGRLLLRLEEAEPGARVGPPRGHAPGTFLNDFALPTPDGRTVTLSDLIGPALLLAVVQADCLFSRAFAHELRRTGASGPPLPVLILSGDRTGQDSLAAFADLPGWLVLDPSGQMARLLRVSATPAGYLVDAERRTASPLLIGPETLLAVARGARVEEAATLPTAVTALDTLPHRGSGALVPLGPGAAAPDITLPLQGGGAWSLRAQRGRPLTILFSDPGCPPCQTLLNELDGVYDDGLVIVRRRSGDNDDSARRWNRSIPIALQDGREAARAFGTLQTPAAFAIDAAGTIVAGPGVGLDGARAIVREARAHQAIGTTRGREPGGTTHE